MGRRRRVALAFAPKLARILPKCRALSEILSLGFASSPPTALTLPIVRGKLKRRWGPGRLSSGRGRRGNAEAGARSARRPRSLTRRSFAASCLSGPIRQNAAEKPRGSPDRIASSWGRIGRAAPDLKTRGGMQEALTSPTPSNHGAGARWAPCRGSAKKRNPAASNVG